MHAQRPSIRAQIKSSPSLLLLHRKNCTSIALQFRYLRTETTLVSFAPLSEDTATDMAYLSQSQFLTFLLHVVEACCLVAVATYYYFRFKMIYLHGARRPPPPADAAPEEIDHMDDNALTLKYVTSTPAKILAPGWASVVDIENVLETAFPKGVTRDSRARIQIKWVDYNANSFDVTRDLGPFHRQVKVREGQVVEDVGHCKPTVVPLCNWPPEASDVILLKPRQVSTEDEDPKCAICLEEKAVGDSVRTLQCRCTNIVYDKDCISYWLRENDTCPFCRLPVAESKVCRYTACWQNTF